VSLAPAKINLALSVTGRRPDGFHELVSLVAPLAWGDDLAAEPAADGQTILECDDLAVPAGPDNLILKAASALREATGWKGGVRFVLRKEVPMGAGLGGGSSDAALALRLLNRRLAEPLPHARLAELAAAIGSDCPLFLEDGPVIMRGRGERIEPLPAPLRARIAGRRILIFKPAFGIATPWAYRELARKAPQAYEPAPTAEARLSRWAADPAADLESILFNSLEAPAFAKFPALPLLLGRLRDRFGLALRMSGSGSACFALLPEQGGPAAGELAAAIREAWGPSAWIRETRILRPGAG
jgi:4-diphosphocytidyl-2-C-methyl-D-erythritol kinase